MQDKANLKEYLMFQIHRNVVNLYKRYLNLIEDIQEDHTNMLNKLNKEIDLEKLKNVDYFDDNKYNYLRKKILDLGNETIREIEKNFDFLNIEIKKWKQNILTILQKPLFQLILIYKLPKESLDLNLDLILWR